MNEFQSYNYNNKSVNGCKENLQKATSRCGRNFAISTAAAVGVGVFTGGLGYAFGAATAMVVASLCADDANQDYYKCISA